MRAVLIAALLLSGCDDDSTNSSAADLSAGGDDLSLAGRDLAGGDMPCAYRTFTGFIAGQTTPSYFSCACGCLIDSFESAAVSPLWGASMSTNASFVPMTGVGLGVALTSSSNTLEQGGLASEGRPTSQFYLDGDFDLRVEYDFGATPPPGSARLILGVRKPQSLNGTPQYEIEREQRADGANYYETMLGGVPAQMVATTETKGVLRLTRQGFTLTAYAGATQVSTLIAQEAGRLVVTLAATLQGCTVSDLGTSCGYTPRWHKLELSSGTLVNLPQ
ncbi:MAG: hypothetical protein JWN44_5170 [Myxococcales bacterium]|nr:hypothetical protein [Myxococcales bacterium]